MSRKRKKLFNLAFLFIFLTVTLFINFFHTEKTITNKIDDCPACQFLSSSFTTSQINFFYLPTPSFSGFLKLLYSFNYTYTVNIEPSSRSPPET